MDGSIVLFNEMEVLCDFIAEESEELVAIKPKQRGKNKRFCCTSDKTH